MGLPVRIVDELFQRLRKDQLCISAVTSKASSSLQHIGGSPGPWSFWLKTSTQPGAVSIEDYVSRINAQSVSSMKTTPEALRRAFETWCSSPNPGSARHAVVSDAPSSSMGRRERQDHHRGDARQLFEKDTVWLPYAVEVDGQIITYTTRFYIIGLNRPLRLTMTADGDVPRPRVMAGGELAVEMLICSSIPAPSSTPRPSR